MVKKILLTISTVITLIILFWGASYIMSGPIMGGCFDTTKTYGLPLPIYKTSGYGTTCDEGFIPQEFFILGLIIDLIFWGTILSWVTILIKKFIPKKNNNQNSPEVALTTGQSSQKNVLIITISNVILSTVATFYILFMIIESFFSPRKFGFDMAEIFVYLSLIAFIISIIFSLKDILNANNNLGKKTYLYIATISLSLLYIFLLVSYIAVSI